MPNPEEKEDQSFGTFQEGCVRWWYSEPYFYLIIIFFRWRCNFFGAPPTGLKLSPSLQHAATAGEEAPSPALRIMPPPDIRRGVKRGGKMIRKKNGIKWPALT